MSSIIESVFFAEFDNIVGPKIAYQVPNEFMSSDQFEAIETFVITGPELCNKIITVTAFGHKIIGYPVRIENPKYHRNALIFNFCFVLPIDSQTVSFEPILRKLASSFTSLEAESAFISNPVSKKRLEEMLPKIFLGLNERGECILAVDAANSINLKLFPDSTAPTDVFDHNVPVLTKELDETVTSDWDLALQEVLPFIDGLRHVKRIALEANMDVDLVRVAVRQLLFYRCATLIDIFQFSNMYCTTSRIERLARNARMQKECMEYIIDDDCEDAPSFAKIFALYCSLERGLRLNAFCAKYDLNELGIDPARFVIFGLTNGFIRRVREYPLRLNPDSADKLALTSYSAASSSQNELLSFDSNSDPQQIQQQLKLIYGVFGETIGQKIPPEFAIRLIAMLDGTRSFDEICCELNLSFSQLRTLLEHANGVVVVMK